MALSVVDGPSTFGGSDLALPGSLSTYLDSGSSLSHSSGRLHDASGRQCLDGRCAGTCASRARGN